jgi:hypothetical protein
MDDQQQWTYDAIVSRCKNLHPSVDITKHIKPGTCEVKSRLVDGINFEAVDPDALEAELSGRMKLPGMEKTPSPKPGPFSFDITRGSRPPGASMFSMQEDPDHWAAKASFGATIGTGFREEWKPVPDIGVPGLPKAKYGSDRLSLGFGELKHQLKFTSLHAAVSKVPPRGCNIHIDERGFMVALPDGVVVTPSSWSHIANELLLQTKFQEWLEGKIGGNIIGDFVVGAVSRLSLRFSDAENGFAGLQGRVNRINGLTDIKGMARTVLPIGLSEDLYYFKNSKVQFNYYWYDDQHTFTLSWGGTFDKWGSK